MLTRQSALLILLTFGLLLGGCATYRFEEPVEVNLVGVEPMPGEGLEFRMLVKLRVQNPNNASLSYDGLSLLMDVQGKRFAAGVSDAEGSIPRFGDTIIEVPVSISAFGMARQALGVARNEYQGELSYEIRGKLYGYEFDTLQFRSQGEFTLPAGLF